MRSEDIMRTRLRRKIQTYDDPYLLDLKPEEVALCRECRSVYARKHWILEEQAGKELERSDKIIETLCPACRKIRDRMPGGIVTITGAFMQNHSSEIINLLHNENQEAMETNPIERIMDIERTDSKMTVLTTNEKLAQKLGHAIYKAYAGELYYKWSKGNKLARVSWHRD